MKILIIRNCPSYMDVENNTYNIQEVGLAKALIRKGNECAILFWTDKKEKQVRIKVDDAYLNVYYRRAVTVLKNAIYTQAGDLYEKYDVLQSSEYNQLESIWLALKYPKKTIIYHGPYYSSFNKRYNLYCKIFDIFFLWIYKKKKTRFITKSRLASDYLISKGLNVENVDSIGVGIDTEMLTCPQNDVNSSIYNSLLNEKGLKLLYIGKIEPRRNIHMIIEIVKSVIKKISDVKLYIIGTGEKEYVNKIKNYILESRVENAIVWENTMEQKYLGEIYKQADIFLLPTEYEIFGMVLLEAMYYGKLVLTTSNGGAQTLIQDGENGYILSNNDLENWTRIIERYYYHKEEYQNMKYKAKQTVAESFTWQVLADKFIKAYGKLWENEKNS